MTVTFGDTKKKEHHDFVPYACVFLVFVAKIRKRCSAIFILLSFLNLVFLRFSSYVLVTQEQYFILKTKENKTMMMMVMIFLSAPLPLPPSNFTFGK